MDSELLSNNEPDLFERLYTHADRMARVIGLRHLGKPTNLDATATYIEQELMGLGHSVERQIWEVKQTEGVSPP